MIETVEEKIDRFCEHFERQATYVGSLSETRESHILARILFTSMLDTFSKVSADDREDRIPSGKRFVTFINGHSGWDAANRVSLFHLDRALKEQDCPAFSGLCSWVADALSKALNIETPASIVQHPAVVEPLITVDSTLKETEKHWPKANGRSIRLKLGSNSVRGGLRPCHFTHAELLWRYRCCLIHEFRLPGEGWEVRKEGEPYYQNMGGFEPARFSLEGGLSALGACVSGRLSVAALWHVTPESSAATEERKQESVPGLQVRLILAFVTELRHRIAGAGLDVFDQEPPPDDHPLFALENVILSPHSAGLSKEAAIRMAISTAKNVLAGIDGKLDPSMVVNSDVL